MLPNPEILKQIPRRILNIPNKRKESKRREHYSLFLLCHEAGLRVSEAINFDLNSKTQQGLYKITKTKGQKERLAYIPKKVVSELKKHDWQPNSTNRFNFYHFLRKIKRELNLPANIELTPHTLRRSFATYQAENGLPLPLLSKILGHQSVRTTALYWMNIYNDGGNDTDDILTAKIWPKRPKRPSLESEAPVNLNLEELPEPTITNSLVSEPPHLTKIQHLEHKLSQIQSEKNELATEKKALQTDLTELSEQNTTLRQELAHANIKKEQVQQDLAEKDQIIKKLEQKLTAEQNKRIVSENNLFTERQSSQSLRETNANLTQKLHACEQNHINLQNAYQQAIKNKQEIIKLVQTEKQRADYYENQLKSIVQTLYQWQKLHCYQQLEPQTKTEARIIQVERPPPWRNK